MQTASETMDRPGAAAQATDSAFVGRRHERLEDAALLSGRGTYGDDLPVKPGTLHAAIVRSPHAHARVLEIDATAAQAVAGVRAVLTPADVKRWSQPFVVGVKSPMEHWSLAQERVRYVGEPVAVVVAQDRYVAEDAAERVRVRYEVLAVAVDIEAAIADGAPLLHPAAGSNVVSDRCFRYGEPDVAFAAARHRIALTVHYPRNSCTPIEGGVVIAEHLAGDEGYEVSSNFMGPFSLHAVMAMALKVPGTRLRHRLPRDSGGSFGVKHSVFPYVVLMCLAARKAGAPVKWVEDRLEHLVAATSATSRRCTIEAAVDGEGRIDALSYDQLDDVGGYLRAPEPATFYRMHGCLTGAYAIAHLKVRNRVVLTNRTPAGLVRGFGGPQVYFALERLVQRIAQQLDLDPLQVYRRNFVPPSAFPYRAAAGALLDSGNYPLTLEMACREGQLPALLQRRDAARAAGRLYGIGFAAIVEPSISNMGYLGTVMTAGQRAQAGPKNGAIASASVGIDPLGGVTVVVASAPAGQGHMTVCAQVVADVLGLVPEQVAVNVDFDTHKDAWSVAAGNYSSRFAGAVAGTVHLAACRLRDKLARLVAHQLACDAADVVFAGGQVGLPHVPGKMLPFARAASSAHWAPGLMPEGESPGLRVTEFWTPPQLTAPDAQDRINTSAAYGFVFDLCAVEIDRDTGRVRVDRYVTAHDAGRLLNPALADGQIRGAFAQGLGAALMEELRYADDGSFLSGTFADYAVPTACEIPDPVIVHLESPSPFTVLGAKGLGEGNNMSTPVCLANAVADALAATHGPCDLRLPLTPCKLLELIGFEDPAPRSGTDAGTDTGTGTGTGTIPAPAAAHARGRGGAKALSASGSVQIAAPPQAIFDILLDPEALARVVPGCHALEASGEHGYRADVTLGVGLVQARYAVEMALSELDPPHALTLAGAGHSALGSARGSARVVLEPNGGGTLVRYDYSAEISGKVAAVGGRMLEGAARMVLGQLFEQLGRQAMGQPVGTARTGWWSRLRARLGLGGRP